jgi:hypothetical protein
MARRNTASTAGHGFRPRSANDRRSPSTIARHCPDATAGIRIADSPASTVSIRVAIEYCSPSIVTGSAARRCSMASAYSGSQ